MGKIQLLPEEVINKIAAGEVVERPASIVKELIENSLDAGATEITIELEQAGKALLRVTDNGEGMDKEDAHKALERHATSKIRSADDLFSIHTLGFRGEALASIAAVSLLSLTTQQEDKIEGYCIAAIGGQNISKDSVAAEQGTIIEVKDLFFNTPARKKFLKSDAVELRHGVDVILRYALSNPLTGFRLLHEGEELLHAPPVGEVRERIASLFGAELARDCLPVIAEEAGICIKGYIAKPQQARKDKSKQMLFVNKRWVRNEYVTKAVADAYHSLLPVHQHPVFFLALELDPQTIDVNIHPQKTEVKIEQAERVCQAVHQAVRQTLEKHNLVPSMTIASEEVDFSAGKKQEIAYQKEAQHQKQRKVTGVAKYVLEPSQQTVLQVKDAQREDSYGTEATVPEKNKEELKLRLSIPITPAKSNAAEEEKKHKETQQEPEKRSSPYRKLPPLKLLGQAHRTFFVAETHGGIVFIDQHVVQERILYERFMEQYMNKAVAMQQLLQGEVLDVSPAESLLMQEKREELEQLGFALEPFGKRSYVLKTIPTIFGKVQPKELLHDVLATLEEQQNSLEQAQEAIITRMACRASVKAGDEVSIPQMEKLLAELEQCILPYTCPHGRAIIIKLPVEELEKKFKRR
ncbi:MAG TPA: DNA mismatch repair endonuclease MutL [Candidatus Nanoarchaeia archaeon]|nr:DNA mismatch repair endonuclease MutL [Candidatus Nanoarchaeia archaeon]